ncbi:collagen alpha-1(I) chain-like [Eubalaena glacialis]|uniref:collagen alpha-1(I) chain-like n=1 Tax=Eubalaena glacialis TaxID=27606 RepID=UPI002A59C598|nr:collagen alpha-1(I) chain-like [Eubalaena glacialis]
MHPVEIADRPPTPTRASSSRVHGRTPRGRDLLALGLPPPGSSPRRALLDHVPRPEPKRDTESPDPEGATPPRAPSGRSMAALCNPAPPPAPPPPAGSCDRGPAAMPRLHPGRRAGSGVPGPRGHRRAGGEERTEPGSGGGCDRVSSDHASGWGPGPGPGPGPLSEEAPPAPEQPRKRRQQEHAAAAAAAAADRAERGSARRGRGLGQPLDREGRRGGEGRGGDSAGRTHPCGPKRAGPESLHERGGRGAEDPRAARFPASAALRSRSPSPLPPSGDPEAGQPQSGPLPSCHPGPGPGQERTTLGIPINGTRAAGVNAPQPLPPVCTA